MPPPCTDGTGAVFQMTLKGITVDPSNTDAAKDLFKTLALNALPFNNYPPEQINVELIPIYGRRRHLMGTILGYIIKFTLTESAFIPVNQISSVLEAPSFLSGLVQVGRAGQGPAKQWPSSALHCSSIAAQPLAVSRRIGTLFGGARRSE
jgi:hypothetical protein